MNPIEYAVLPADHRPAGVESPLRPVELYSPAVIVRAMQISGFDAHRMAAYRAFAPDLRLTVIEYANSPTRMAVSGFHLREIKLYLSDWLIEDWSFGDRRVFGATAAERVAGGRFYAADEGLPVGCAWPPPEDEE